MQLTEVGRQHPKPLVWDFVFACDSLGLWAPASFDLGPLAHGTVVMSRSAVVMRAPVLHSDGESLEILPKGQIFRTP